MGEFTHDVPKDRGTQDCTPLLRKLPVIKRLQKMFADLESHPVLGSSEAGLASTLGGLHPRN